MNFAALCTTGMMASFKYIAAEGYHAADFNMLRNVVGLIITTIWTVLIGLNPFKTFPLHYKGWMLVRLLAGQANFVMLNVASTLAPISLTLVIWQTSPFWISILAHYLLKESIYAVEIVSMLICFVAVVLIATQAMQKQDEDSSEEESNKWDNTDTAFTGYVITMIASFLMALIAVSNRAMKEVSTAVIGFWYFIGGLGGTIIYLAIEALIKGELRMSDYTLR